MAVVREGVCTFLVVAFTAPVWLRDLVFLSAIVLSELLEALSIF